MRQLHAYIVAAQGRRGGIQMRMMLAVVVAACGLAARAGSGGRAPSLASARRSATGSPIRRGSRRPPSRCTRSTAGRGWPDWRSPRRAPRFGSRRLARTPPVPATPATTRWRRAPSCRTRRASGSCRRRSCTGAGTPWRAGRPRRRRSETPVAALRDCQLTAPLRLAVAHHRRARRGSAAVISVAGRACMHEYLLADPRSSTIVELALWSTLPPQVGLAGRGRQRRCSTRWPPRCATRTSVRAGEAVPANPPVE